MYYRDTIWAVYKRLDPDSVARRRAKKHWHLGEARCPGPNYCWSLDGHDKFRQFGIQIYAAIDVYSLKIIWTYCGRSNRSNISVAWQYIHAIDELGFRPQFLRTDRGSETSFLRRAQLLLYRKGVARDPENIDEILQEDDIARCYLYGTSKENFRIERWWGVANQGKLQEWRVYFHELKERSLWSLNSLSDRIAFMFIYIPIIDKEIQAYVADWNAHLIRKDRRRPNHVSGRPCILYECPPDGVQDCLEPIDYETVNELKSFLDYFGNLYVISVRSFLTANWAYAVPGEIHPAETEAWCLASLVAAGLPNPRDLQPGEFDAQGIRMHLQCYLHLREAVKCHIQSGQQPTLQLHKSLALEEQREVFRQLGISGTAIDEINIEPVDFEDDNFIPQDQQISTSLD